MLNDSIRQMALEMLVGAVRHPNSKTRFELAALFWNLQYIHKFGILKLAIPDPNGSELDSVRSAQVVESTSA